MTPVHLIHPFEPLFSPDSRILILGSFPSVRSREQQFFYGHPRNRFWKLLASVFHVPCPITIPEKRDLVLSSSLALWDSIGECTVTGSSDTSIRDVKPVDIRRILDEAEICRVLCNGTLSWKMYEKYLLEKTGIPAVVLPSTSPANAAFSLERLTEIWGPFLRL